MSQSSLTQKSSIYYQNPELLNSQQSNLIYQIKKIKQPNYLNILNRSREERNNQIQQLCQNKSFRKIKNILNSLKDLPHNGQGHQNIKKYKQKNVQNFLHMNRQKYQPRLMKKRSISKLLSYQKNKQLDYQHEQNDTKMAILQKIADINNFKYQNGFISQAHYHNQSTKKNNYETIDHQFHNKSSNSIDLQKNIKSHKSITYDKLSNQKLQQSYINTLNNLDVKERFHLNKKKLYKTLQQDKTSKQFYTLQNSTVKLSKYFQDKKMKIKQQNKSLKNSHQKQYLYKMLSCGKYKKQKYQKNNMQNLLNLNLNSSKYFNPIEKSENKQRKRCLSNIESTKQVQKREQYIINPLKRITLLPQINNIKQSKQK